MSETRTQPTPALHGGSPSRSGKQAPGESTICHPQAALARRALWPRRNEVCCPFPQTLPLLPILSWGHAFMLCSKLAALQKPYLGLKGQPTQIKRASAPCPARAVSFTFADRNSPPVAFTDEPNGFLACQGSQPSALLAACPHRWWCDMFRRGWGVDSNQREVSKMGPMHTGNDAWLARRHPSSQQSQTKNTWHVALQGSLSTNDNCRQSILKPAFYAASLFLVSHQMFHYELRGIKAWRAGLLLGDQTWNRGYSTI